MDHSELIGLRAPAGPIRPVGGVPCAVLSLVVALLPIRPTVVWGVAVPVCVALPWVLGALRRRRRPDVWRLSDDGLVCTRPDGSVVAAYERRRIEEFALTTDDGVLTVFHKFGGTAVGRLVEMGFDPLSFFVTARGLGITTHVIDGERTVFDSDDMPSTDSEAPRALGRRAERRLRDQEAALLDAAHEPPGGPDADTDPGTGRREPLRLRAVMPRRRMIRLAVVFAALGLVMLGQVVSAAWPGVPSLRVRLLVGCWALAATVAVVMARRRGLAGAALEWVVTTGELRVRRRAVGEWRVPVAEVAAVAVGPGVAIDPVSGSPAGDRLAAVVFGHRLQVLARLPAHGLDPFQLTHVLDERGYRVVTPEAGMLRPAEYGLDRLPDIFSRVPGGRLVVDDEGVGWADGAGDVILRMPRERIGGLELLTVDGHAWLRMYDDDGDEFLAAPLSMLRISRTDLRESARRASLPVTDAEYDAYVNATFHGAVLGIDAEADVPMASEPKRSAPEPRAETILLDVPGRARMLAYALTAVLCEVIAVLGAFWLRSDLGGYWTALGWAAPVAAVLGLSGAWLYDRNRPQLRVSSASVASVTRLGRTEWNVSRELLGGVGVDESEATSPRLVVWNPVGRVLHRVSFPPDLHELRRACERCGLPWGPPDADRAAAPPPEI